MRGLPKNARAFSNPEALLEFAGHGSGCFPVGSWRHEVDPHKCLEMFDSAISPQLPKYSSDGYML